MSGKIGGGWRIDEIGADDVGFVFEFRRRADFDLYEGSLLYLEPYDG